MTTLNVGCGNDVWGDVRVDVSQVNQLGDRISPNLIASAEALPFRDGVFSEARCYHVLEHLPNPRKAVREIQRVSESATLRFPVDDGFKRHMVISLLVMHLPGIRSAYLTRKLHAHLWIIHPSVGGRNGAPLFPFFIRRIFGRYTPHLCIEWEVHLSSGEVIPF